MNRSEMLSVVQKFAEYCLGLDQLQMNLWLSHRAKRELGASRLSHPLLHKQQDCSSSQKQPNLGQKRWNLEMQHSRLVSIPRKMTLLRQLPMHRQCCRTCCHCCQQQFHHRARVMSKYDSRISDDVTPRRCILLIDVAWCHRLCHHWYH